ncbi:MAG: HAD family hydrolase [Deltaproteobacteria bacterium]
MTTVLSLDVDGTLYRVRRLRVAWRLRWERGLLVALVAAREKIRHEGPFDSPEALERREAELIAPSFNMTVEACAERLDELREAMPEALTSRVRPYPGVAGALEAAVAKGVQLAVLSDYAPDDKLAYLGLDHLPWRARIGADRLGVLKPSRRAFEAVAEATGAPLASIVHVGDREDVDVEGALDAGCRAWRFSDKSKVTSRAEVVFSRWTIDLFEPLWRSD